MAETTGQIKTTTVDQLPEERNINSLWMFGYNPTKPIGQRSVKVPFSAITPQFGVENAMGISTTVAPSQKVVKDALTEYVKITDGAKIGATSMEKIGESLTYSNGVLNNWQTDSVLTPTTKEHFKTNVNGTLINIGACTPEEGGSNANIWGYSTPLNNLKAGDNIYLLCTIYSEKAGSGLTLGIYSSTGNMELLSHNMDFYSVGWNTKFAKIKITKDTVVGEQKLILYSRGLVANKDFFAKSTFFISRPLISLTPISYLDINIFDLLDRLKIVEDKTANISTMLLSNLIYVSGVNQLNNSNKMKVGYTNTPDSIKMEMVDDALKVTIVGGPSAGYFNTIINGASTPLKDICAGQEITYSARIKLLNGVIYPIFYVYSNMEYFSLTPIEGSEDSQGFKLCYGTKKATTTKINAFANPSMRLGGVDSSILIKDLKIEVGSSPTPHSLSIADMLNYPAVPTTMAMPFTRDFKIKETNIEQNESTTEN